MQKQQIFLFSCAVEGARIISNLLHSSFDECNPLPYVFVHLISLDLFTGIITLPLSSFMAWVWRKLTTLMLDCEESEEKYKRASYEATTNDMDVESDFFEKSRNASEEVSAKQLYVPPPQTPGVKNRLADETSTQTDLRSSLKQKISEAMRKDQPQ